MYQMPIQPTIESRLRRMSEDEKYGLADKFHPIIVNNLFARSRGGKITALDSVEALEEALTTYETSVRTQLRPRQRRSILETYVKSIFHAHAHQAHALGLVNSRHPV